MVAEQAQPAGPSLRRSLLLWLLPSVLIMLVLSVVSDYEMAIAPTLEVYDQALVDAALVVRDRIERGQDGKISIYWSQGAAALLSSNQSDQAFFSVFDLSGKCLGGSCWLLPSQQSWQPEQATFRDMKHQDLDIRVVSYYSRVHENDLAIQVGETTHKRHDMSQRIVIGMLVPELLTILSVLMAVLIGVRRGLEPLARLQRLVDSRPGADTGKLPEQQMPSEIVGLVHTHNLQADRLQDSLQLQEVFITNAAHQLRTPLAGLRAQTEVAVRLMAREPVSQDLRKAIENSHLAASRSVRLVQQLLGLARSQASADSFSDCNLSTVAERVVAHTLGMAESRQVDIGLDLTEAPVRGIDLLLDELLANLIDNAVKYCPAGSRITIRTACVNGQAELMVEDDGPGIPEADHERVFERFYRREQGIEGVGLGLAIVREIAELHHARVELSSVTPGSGLRVLIRFPVWQPVHEVDPGV